MAIKKGDIYMYKTGKYVREKLNDKKGCVDYRIKELNKPGRKLLICITEKEGKRGGHTKAIALLRSIHTEKGKRLMKIAKIKERRS